MIEESPRAQQLFALLVSAQGPGYRSFLSGAQLARDLGVSRSAIWKAAASLRSLGVAIEALPRQGYRLARAASPLEQAAVINALLPDTAARLRQGECRWSTASTNADLLSRGGLSAGEFDFLTAEYQSAGRGRRGRRWLAPPGGSICLSWSWSFEVLPPQSGALSLAIGVAALRALRRCGVTGVDLKWPNDLVTPDGKLGGILIELRSESGGPTHVVVGIGLNVVLGPEIVEDVASTGNRATDLATLTPQPPARSQLVAALLDAGTAAMAEFARTGFDSFIAEYRHADVLAGQPVTVSGPQDSMEGSAAGIDHDGALLVDTPTGRRRIVSGEISVRRT